MKVVFIVALAVNIKFIENELFESLLHSNIFHYRTIKMSTKSICSYKYYLLFIYVTFICNEI